MILSLLSISVVHLLAVMSPGPDFALVIKNSIAHGRKSGLFTAGGILAGNIILIIFTVFGLASVVNSSIYLRSGIMFFGGIYLCCIGIKSIRPGSEGDGRIDVKSGGISFVSGFITNITNVKAALYYTAVFSKFIIPGMCLSRMISYFAVVAAVTGIWFGSAAFIFTSDKIKKAFLSRRRVINLCMGSVLAALGIWIIISSVCGLFSFLNNIS